MFWNIILHILPQYETNLPKAMLELSKSISNLPSPDDIEDLNKYWEAKHFLLLPFCLLALSLHTGSEQTVESVWGVYTIVGTQTFCKKNENISLAMKTNLPKLDF